MPDNGGVHQFHTSKIKSALGTVAYGFFPLAIITVFSEMDEIQLSWENILAVPVILLFGFGALRSFTVLIKFGPAFIVDDLGIIDNISSMKAGRMTWDEIESVSLDMNRIGVADYSSLYIYPKNGAALLARYKATRPIASKLIPRLGEPSISLSGFEMKGKLDAIDRLVQDGLAANRGAAEG